MAGTPVQRGHLRLLEGGKSKSTGGIFEGQQIPDEDFDVKESQTIDFSQPLSASDGPPAYQVEGLEPVYGGQPVHSPPVRPLAMGQGPPPPRRSPELYLPEVRPVNPGQYLVSGSPMVPVRSMGNPDVAPPKEYAHILGLSALTVGAGTIIGLRYGGMYGALAGSLFAGVAMNAARAISYATKTEPHAKREALVSASYAVAIGVFAGYLTHLAIKQKRSGRKAA